MITLVTGGSGSGKSEYAEQLISQTPRGRRYYVATMIAWGREGKEKVRRHQKLRRGKGFFTLEQPADLYRVRLDGAGESAVLLECVSNLAANEMFGQEREGGAAGVKKSPNVEELAHKIVEDILSLARQARDMVIVTNEVDRDGVTYEDETMEYIRLMGLINRRLSGLADQVVEVVCGIPVVLKTSQGERG